MTQTQTTKQVVMPKLGLTMQEATISEWLKVEGERVRAGEVLFTFESDKATLEFEAPAAGVLHILVPAGETVPVMTPVATLSGGDAAAESAPAPPDGETLRASPKARALARQRGASLDGVTGSGARGMIVAADVPEPADDAIRATPVARKIAAEAGLDLRRVAGSGPRGRITRDDVERVLAAPPPSSAPVPAAAPGLDVIPGLRGVIARKLTQGWQERPQVTLTTDVDATNLVAMRQQAGEELGEKVAYDALLMLIVARALREFPYMNARLTPDGIAHVDQINIGAAVDTERGLVVPVVWEPDKRTLRDINHALRDVVERALAGESLPDDFSGGTFTITNLGMFGIDAFTPIINPPEAAILGVGRIVARPVGVDGQIVLRQMMALSLSFDHRLVDGAPAARFLARVRALIERPFALFLG